MEKGLHISPLARLFGLNIFARKWEIHLSSCFEIIHELDLFLNTVEANFPSQYPFFFTLSRTGIRIGEAIALDWPDVDFNGRFLHIRRSCTDGSMGPTKNRKARKVDLSEQTLEILRAHRTRMKKRTLERGWGELPLPVFASRAGTRFAERNLRKVLNKSLGKAGLSHRGFHDFRHTYASLLLMAGASVLYVSQQLGHSSPQITMSIYAHWIPSGDQRDVNRLDSLQPAATYMQPSDKIGLDET